MICTTDLTSVPHQNIKCQRKVENKTKSKGVKNNKGERTDDIKHNNKDDLKDD